MSEQMPKRLWVWPTPADKIVPTGYHVSTGPDFDGGGRIQDKYVHVDEVARMVEAAYREGFNAGGDALSRTVRGGEVVEDVMGYWDHSKAKAGLHE